ncbi:unnamed protein product [Ixodes persulcatus]
MVACIQGRWKSHGVGWTCSAFPYRASILMIYCSRLLAIYTIYHLHCIYQGCGILQL